MNEAVKWVIAGVFLLSFHIDFMGIPIVPGITGCLAFCSGFRILGQGRDGEEFEWSCKVKQTGGLWLSITILDLILVVFMRQNIGTSIQITVVPMLAETACGRSMLNHYGELGRQYTRNYKKGPSSLGYFIWMTAGLTSCGYSVVSENSGWNIMGVVRAIIGRIMLVKELTMWIPREKTGY